MNETFSIVYYDDGAVEIVAGNVATTDGVGMYKITNQFVLDYVKANNVGVRYIEAGITHVRVDLLPQLAILDSMNEKQIELSEDVITNNYNAG